jgi:Fic family protein
MPAPLPDRLDLSTGTWHTVVEAAKALSKLDQGSKQIPVPELLRRPAIRREAQSTSALEGTYAAFTDLLEAEQSEAPRRGAIVELLNYVDAAEKAYASDPGRPLTMSFLGGLQKVLVANTPGELPDAGGIRDRQVVVGSPGGSLLDARYVPPPPGDQLKHGVEHLLAWINDLPDGVSPLVGAALAHYQFEALHPFSDGNGRIGRMLIVLQLMRDRQLSIPVLVVSPWFEARRREYQDQLLDLSATGDFDAWVAFFCEGIRAQAVTTQERVQSLLDYQVEAREICRRKKIRGVASRVAEDLIGNPMLTPTRIAEEYGVSYQAANKAILRLEQEDLLTEITGRKYGRMFASDDVLRILQA